MFPWRRLALRRRVIVNLKTSESLKGVLWTKNGPLLVIKEALFYDGKAEATKVDGEILVERSNVSFIQVLPEG